MPKKELHMRIKEWKSDLGVLKDFELSIGKIIEETYGFPKADPDAPLAETGFMLVLRQSIFSMRLRQKRRLWS